MTVPSPRFELPPRVRPPVRAVVALIALSGLIVTAGSGFSACGGKSAGPGGSGGSGGLGGGGQGGMAADDAGAPFSRSELLAAFGACALASARDFQSAALALDSAARTYADASADSERDAAREQVRARFREAMAAWQVSEVMQFGPAAAGDSPGGLGLRSHIYSWPLVDLACNVEDEILAQGYLSPTFGSGLINRHGLATLEQLLYRDGPDESCMSAMPGYVSGPWAAVAPDELASRRRRYAAAAAADLRARADALVSAWEPTQGNFLGKLQTAGQGSPLFSSTQAALNVVSDALFYVESEVKDMKLAQPLGRLPCATSPCLESRFGGLSKDNLRANFVGMRQLIRGCGADGDGLGFEDLLRAIGQATLADALVSAIAAVDAALAAIEEADLAGALAADPASVQALYDALKVVTTLLKVDMITVLDLELPMGLEGDVD